MPVLTRKEHIVIVNAYSGGRYLIPAFQALGYPVIHVQSGEPGFFVSDNEFAAHRADRHLVAEGDIDDLVHTLRAASVRLVLAGSEGGVLLADELAHLLELPFRNDITLSVARRDKFEMQERLRDLGIASIPHARVAGTGELDAWLATNGSYPVVVKPLRSAGTDGVHVCHTRSEAVLALETILASRDMFGNRNEAAVCQNFLVGHEYVLNGVACGGTCMFTEGWRSDKIDNKGFRVYDTQYLFYMGDPGFDELSRYVGEVCDALGIVNGPFHAEVMLTSDGPVLIEIGARIAGGADPYVIETCLGHSQVSRLVSASLHPDAFARDHAVQRPAAPLRRAAYVYLVATSAGEVRQVALERFLGIDGVLHVDYHYAEGDYQEMTRDLLSAAGVVIVTAEDQAALDRAVSEIRAVEAEMYKNNITTVPSL